MRSPWGAFARGGRPEGALLVVPLLVLAALHVGLAGELAVLTHALSSEGDLLPATAPVAVALVVAAVVAGVRRRRARVAAVPAI